MYLAAAPKSNAAYSAYCEVKGSLSEHGSLEVPVHLRNAPTNLAEDMGHGEEYRYAHDEAHAEQGGYAAGEIYLPERGPG
ncbi:MAG: hypothetical protein RLZZ385_1165 [Pseudomonadota bacterium]